MKKVSDPTLLQELSAPISDTDILAKLNSPQEIIEEVPETAQETELSGSDISRGRASSALQGATFGWGDEITSGLVATMAKLSGDDKSFSDIYDDVLQAESTRQGIYEEANPNEALAMNLVTGLVSGGAGAAKALSKVAEKGGGALAKTLAGMGVGSLEGGVAGAGYADEGERGEGALFGSAMGAAFPAALGAGGKVAETVAKSRVGQSMMNAAGDFLPLNLAAPEGSALQNFYQKVVGPGFGSGKLREQNRFILNKTMDRTGAAKEALDVAKEGGKKALDKTLRREALKASAPAGASDELLATLNQADGHKSISALRDSWKDGFKVVKDNKFKVNPKEIVDNAIADLDGPVDADFIANIRSTLNKRIGKGFTPDTAAPSTKYKSKGVGVEKVPDVELDTGEVAGDYLMQARNDLKMRASELGDEGAAALEKSALRKAADKIDDQIRSSLSPSDAKIFDDELAAWGNFQSARSSAKRAAANNQGDFTTEDWLQSIKKNQGRATEAGEATLQKEAQQFQTQADETLKNLTGNLDTAKEAEKVLRKSLPELNPTPWQKGVATATTGAIPSAILGTATGGPLGAVLGPLGGAVPTGALMNKGLSTQFVQKLIGGETDTQKALANVLRNYDGSDAQKLLHGAQGAATRAAIDSQLKADEQ